jgi:hypothetical protein
MNNIQTFEDQDIRLNYSAKWSHAAPEGDERLNLASIDDSSKVYVSLIRDGLNPERITPLPEVVAFRVNAIAPYGEFQFISFNPANLSYEIRYGYLNDQDQPRTRLEYGKLSSNGPAMVLLEYDAEAPLYEKHLNDVFQMIRSLSVR